MKAWRKKEARGEVIVVRYADDGVLGFQYRADAERFLEQFRNRLGKFGLELHPEKTRLIEFGRSRNYESNCDSGCIHRQRPQANGSFKWCGGTSNITPYRATGHEWRRTATRCCVSGFKRSGGEANDTG